MFDIFDCDESGTIDFYEFFIAMVTIKHGTMDEQAELAFRLYDQDGDGILTRDEVLQKVTVSTIYCNKYSLWAWACFYCSLGVLFGRVNFVIFSLSLYLYLSFVKMNY